MRRHGADAAAELDRDLAMAPRMASTAARVDRPAREGAVEVDDVQPAEAGWPRSARGLGGRVGVERPWPAPCRPAEAHALAVLQVDGGIEDHGRHLRKFGDESEAERLALLGVELRARDVVAATIAVTGPP